MYSSRGCRALFEFAVESNVSLVANIEDCLPITKFTMGRVRYIRQVQPYVYADISV